jgi:hypothetical protein
MFVKYQAPSILRFSIVIPLLIFGGCGGGSEKTVNQPAQPHFTEIKTNETFVHNPTGMEFPLQIGNFKRVRSVKYDHEGANVSSEYILQSFGFTIAELKVFIYPSETEVNGPLSLDKHYDQTRALLFNIYFDAHGLEEGEIKIGQPFGPQEGKMFSFIYKPPDSFNSKTCYSRLYLFKHGPWFIKYRVTNLPKEDGKVQKAVGEFMHLLHWSELP